MSQNAYLKHLTNEHFFAAVAKFTTPGMIVIFIQAYVNITFIFTNCKLRISESKK